MMSLLTAVLPTPLRAREVTLSGAAQVPLCRDELWRRVHDPDRLAHALPGCEQLVPSGGPDRYDVVLSAQVGPVAGTSSGVLSLIDDGGPSRYRLVVEGTGATGTVRADVEFVLRDHGPVTDVRYEGHAEVDGLVGTVGASVLATATRRAALRFFEVIAAG